VGKMSNLAQCLHSTAAAQQKGWLGYSVVTHYYNKQPHATGRGGVTKSSAATGKVV